MCKEEKSSSVKDIAEAVEAVTKAIPIYDDAIQPAAKEIGKGLQTITKTVNVALAPLEVVIWGYDQIKHFVSQSVSEKLEGTLEEDIITPKISVAGPAIEALRFVADEEELKEMYSNLLANAMDRKTAELTHPGFVEILKNMNSDEAKIMRYFSDKLRLPIITIGSSREGTEGVSPYMRNFSNIGVDANCEIPKLTPNYLDNLERLGLLKVREGTYLTAEQAYTALIENPTTKEAETIINLQSRVIDIQKGVVDKTDLGQQFCNACVIDKNRS